MSYVPPRLPANAVDVETRELRGSGLNRKAARGLINYASGL